MAKFGVVFTAFGYFTVNAESKEEAEKKVSEMKFDEFPFDKESFYDIDGTEVIEEL